MCHNEKVPHHLRKNHNLGIVKNTLCCIPRLWAYTPTNYRSNGARPLGEGGSDGEGGSPPQITPNVGPTDFAELWSSWVTIRDGNVTGSWRARDGRSWCRRAHTFNNIQMPMSDFRWSIRDLSFVQVLVSENSFRIVSNIFSQISDRSAIGASNSKSECELQVVQSILLCDALDNCRSEVVNGIQHTFFFNHMSSLVRFRSTVDRVKFTWRRSGRQDSIQEFEIEFGRIDYICAP